MFDLLTQMKGSSVAWLCWLASAPKTKIFTVGVFGVLLLLVMMIWSLISWWLLMSVVLDRWYLFDRVIEFIRLRLSLSCSIETR